MKIVNTICFFLTVSVMTGQSLFPSSDATWVNTVYSVLEQGGGNTEYLLSETENFCLSNKDTIIYGKKYRQLYICAGAYRGALRLAGQKVYFVPPRSYLEYILYDFGVNQGDIIPNVYMEDVSSSGLPTLGALEVEMVDHVWIGGEYRKRIHFKGAQRGLWIEGIGCTEGLLRSPLASSARVQLNLECMSHRDTSRYPVFSPNPCNLLTLAPINYFVDVYAEVKNINGAPLSNYAVYIGGGSGQGGQPLKKLITGSKGKVHDSLMPGSTPSLYAYVYDCYFNRVLDFEVARIGTESDSTSFEFILPCAADTCDVVLSHALVDADSGVYEFSFETVGESRQVMSPLWSFSDGVLEHGSPGVRRTVEPGDFTYCIDLGCSAKTCNSLYADPNCRAEFFLDTVNSIVFNGNVIFWKNSKLGSQYTYSWDFGDGQTSNRAYPMHSYKQPGQYEICLTVNFNDGVSNCSHTYCDTVLFNQAHLTFQIMDPSTIGIDELMKNKAEYSLFPNPASDEVYIRWDEHEDHLVKVMLYHMNGRLVQEWAGSKEGTEGEQIIRLEEIPPGTYIVKIIMQDVAKTVPLVVQ